MTEKIPIYNIKWKSREKNCQQMVISIIKIFTNENWKKFTLTLATRFIFNLLDYLFSSFFPVFSKCSKYEIPVSYLAVICHKTGFII